MSESLAVRSGRIICYRIYDIADELDLARIERVSRQNASRTRVVPQRSRAVKVPNPPLTLELGQQSVRLNGTAFVADVRARLFDSGAASVVLSIPIPEGADLDQLIPLVAQAQDSPGVDVACAEWIERVRGEIAAAAPNTRVWDNSESYTVLLIQKLDPSVNAARILESAALPRLILGEDGELPLSESQRADVLAHSFSYTENDLAVIDWNSAFVYEPSDASDILDVLEIANAQLLELRYYDAQLDRHIQRTHDAMQQKRRHWGMLLLSPYRKLARRVLLTLLELSEFIERNENSLKVIGDFYVARIYDAAVQQLRVANWQASVTRKQQMLASTYQLLKGETDIDRSLMLESMIVVLIVFEIALALLGPH